MNYTCKPILSKWWYICCIIIGFFLCFIPSIWAIKSWIEAICTKYEFLSDRVRITSGILSKTENEIQLWKITDVGFYEPFSQRIFGRARLVITSVDVLSRHLVFNFLDKKKAYELKESLREQIKQGNVYYHS
jgi:uncharacterized membrane protein YdbT with pleckstrin-like domain